MVALWGALALAGGLAGCDAGPRTIFDREVVPVLEERCATAACHGVRGDEAALPEGLFVAIDADGRLTDRDAAYAAARARITTEVPALSSFLRVPLARAEGGGPHAGGAMLPSRDDPAYAAIERWIDAEATDAPGRGGEDVALDPLEERFGREVLPILVQRCAFSGCHGPSDVATTAIPAHRDPLSGRFSPLEVRAARRSMRKFVDLWGADATRSRIVRKAVGPLAGGLAHRGSPDTFFPEAPVGAPLESDDLQTVLGWIRAEREAMGIEDGRAPTAIVWVRAPVAPRAPYRIAAEPEGSDLFFAAWPLAGEPENLTAALHPEGPAEIRDPAVSHDARIVTFAMRRAGEGTFALWELELATRAAHRLTPEGAPGSFVQPVHGPDGRVVAVWDGHGEAGGDGDGIAPELVAIEADGAFERLTFTRAPEVRPGTLVSGKTHGMVVFGTRRSGGEGVLFRFPPCHDPALHGEPEYHVQFGATIAPAAPLVARDLPDGRQALLVLESTGALDDRGALAILDRSAGPMLREGEPPSVGGYLESLRTLDAEPRWRDPVPLPDGSLIVSTDRDRVPGEDALARVVIADGPDGPSIASVEALRAEPGWSLRSAAIVLARPVEDDEHAEVFDRSLDRARIAIRDATVLEMLYGRAQPTGARALRDDLVAVRVLAPARTEGPGAPGARLLAEIPLADDHSAELDVPARTPLLLQWLDARGMAAGNQLDRWFYGEGGELVPAGTNRATYGSSCAPCHGAISGRPEDAIAPPPDAISAASITLSTHEGRDPRRPIAPSMVGAEGALITFEADVAPLLATRCAMCHRSDGANPDLILVTAPGTALRATYDTLIGRGLVDPDRRARRSPLIERMLGEELDAPAPMRGQCPPEPLGESDVGMLVRWIETGAALREATDAR